jgi:hypothetical protein
MTKWLRGFLRSFSSSAPTTPSQSETKEPAQVNRRATASIAPSQAPTSAKALPPGIRIRRKRVRLQVGVDFGTSSTKVAYQQIGSGVRRVTALLLGHKLPHYPEFCIPSVAAFDRGNFIVGEKAARFLADRPITEGFRFLKLVLAGQYDKSFLDPLLDEMFHAYLNRWSSLSRGAGIEHVVVSFLASTLHEIKRSLRTQFANQELEMAFNVCAPIDHIQNSPLKTVFERILSAAEMVESNVNACEDGNDLLERSCLAYLSAHENKPDAERKVSFVPESVGAIASYLASLQVRNGIHAVYDFGSGTTDVSIFDVSNVGKGTPFTYWRSARNLPRGSQRTERIVTDFLKLEKPATRLSDVDVSVATLALSKQSRVLQEQVRCELRALWEDSHIAWREAYGTLRKQSEWEKGKVQVFVCGGASRLPLIKEIFSESWMRNWGPYPIRDLPGPDVYESANAKAPFNRLCVAYGLTTPRLELGEYLLPRDCPEHTPIKKIKAPKSIYGVDEPDT